MHFSGMTVALIFLLALFSGCIMTTADGARLEAKLIDIELEVSELRRNYSEFQSDAKDKLKAVESGLFKVQKTDASDNEGSRRLQEEVLELRGKLEETEHKLDKLSQAPKVSQSSAVENAPKDLVAPEGRKGHFTWAKEFYDANQVAKSAQAFTLFLERYKSGEFVDSAHYLLGESYYKLGSRAIGADDQKNFYKKAILSYQKMLSEYPSSKKTVDALFHVGMSLEALGLSSDARVFYEEIRSKHGKHELAHNAKKRIVFIDGANKRKSANAKRS